MSRLVCELIDKSYAELGKDARLSWLLNLAYLLTLLAVSPVLAWRTVVRGKYRTGWNEKLFGLLPVRPGHRPCLWFHAVSVGEVLQLEPVLEGLRERLPEAEFTISTTTPTGRSVAETRFPRDQVCYFPLDFSWAVAAAIKRVRPTAIVLVELELWPNFIIEAHRQAIPLALINGRVSERSNRGYARIRPLLARLLARFEVLAMQNVAYRERLANLGAPESRLTATGSIKFDRVQTDRHNPQTAELRRFFEIRDSDPVFIAGSTQEPEEAHALDTYQLLLPRFPSLRLILVPRHKERFDAVAQLVAQRGFPLVRRSRGAMADAPGTNGARPVLLLDTLGELAACWGLADVAFVGGSLTNRGGQNMIEPAGYGAALLFGPHTHNFRDVVELLLSADAARVIATPDKMTTAVADCLANPAAARERGTRAQQLVLAQQGATDRTIDLIMNLSCFGSSEARRKAS